jgi:hypothetical protein
MPRITELYAWVVADTNPDDEGIPAFIDPVSRMWMPLMGADIERAMMLRPQAVRIAEATGKTVRLVRSVSIEQVDAVAPARFN